MTRARRFGIVLVIVSAITVAAASPADAAKKSFWGWLDELSGPGPFVPQQIGTITVTVVTLPRGGGESSDQSRKGNGLRMFIDDPAQRKLFFTAEIGTWKAEAKEGFGRPNLFIVNGLAYLPLGVLAGDSKAASAFDLGGGLGVYTFSGDGVKSEARHAAAIPIRIRITPVRFFVKQSGRMRGGSPLVSRLAAITYTIGWDILTTHFTNEDFVAPPSYRSNNEALFRFGFQVDMNQLLHR